MVPNLLRCLQWKWALLRRGFVLPFDAKLEQLTQQTKDYGSRWLFTFSGIFSVVLLLHYHRRSLLVNLLWAKSWRPTIIHGHKVEPWPTKSFPLANLNRAQQVCFIYDVIIHRRLLKACVDLTFCRCLPWRLQILNLGIGIFGAATKKYCRFEGSVASM